MTQDLMRKISSVRRKTRDMEVLDICDYAEKQLTKPPLIISGSDIVIKKDIETVRRRGPFDKKSYQRDYMRKRRAGAKKSS